MEFFARDEHVSTVSEWVCVCVRKREKEREHLHAWFQSNAHDIHIVTGVRNVSRETWPVHDFIWWRDTGLQEITRKYAQPLLSTGTKQEIFFLVSTSSDGDFIDGSRYEILPMIFDTFRNEIVDYLPCRCDSLIFFLFSFVIFPRIANFFFLLKWNTSEIYVY